MFVLKCAVNTHTNIDTQQCRNKLTLINCFARTRCGFYQQLLLLPFLNAATILYMYMIRTSNNNKTAWKMFFLATFSVVFCLYSNVCLHLFCSVHWSTPQCGNSAIAANKCYANCCSHSLSHCITVSACLPVCLWMCVCTYVVFFHNRNIFAVAFATRILTYTNALSCCCRFTLLLLCYHCICFVLHVLSVLHRQTHKHRYTHTYPQRAREREQETRMCTKKWRLKSVVDSVSGFYFILCVVSLPLCFLRADAFRYWALYHSAFCTIKQTNNL